MTDISQTPPSVQAQTAHLITQLQSRLLALGQAEDEASVVPAAEIEKTAKAINQLIASIEKAENYLSQQSDQPRWGEPLTGERRQNMLRKIKRMVENGILDELDD